MLSARKLRAELLCDPLHVAASYVGDDGSQPGRYVCVGTGVPPPGKDVTVAVGVITLLLSR